MAKANAVFVRSLRPPSVAYFVACGFAALCFSSTALSASDAWKDKDPQAWDQKDVQKILNDSPWAKQLQFGIASDGSLSSNVASVGSSGISETSGSGAGGSKGLGSPGGAYGPAGSKPTGITPNSTPQTKFIVRWRSSLTVREALLREKELSGMLPDDARKDAAATYDSYQIAISGGDLRAFSAEGVAALKARSYLTTKSSKQTISPSNVVIQTRQDGTPIAIIFEFPKKTAGGEPTIAPNEKSVEFGAKVSGLPMKVTFDVSKMSGSAGTDL